MTPSPNSYDQVPYASHPYSQSSPERLATIGTLLGMTPRPIDKARVLELGCSSGGNLLPLAERFPDSTFLGIDGSARQIAEGRELLVRLGLSNANLEHRDILDIDPGIGNFDYVIAHGVYSWVSPHVQDKILAICRGHLSDNGIAYISYNTFPGWHLRGVVRDLMLYRASGFDRPADRVRHARGLLDFLADSVSVEDNAYGMLLRKELGALRDKDDDYLYHDHLEDHNEPLYFHQFIDRAQKHELQYLGEADYSVMCSENFPPQVEKVLLSIAPGTLELEQYMDFLRNRMFRQTLLCRREVAIERQPAPDRILGMHVACQARPETPVVDVRSNAQAVFRGPRAVTTTTDPLMKAALLHLSEAWPRSVPLTDLIALARSNVGGAAAIVDGTRVTRDSRKLAAPLLRCYATGQVELSVCASAFDSTVSERPKASALARQQAAMSNRVTNRRHESVVLDDLQRHVLRNLDGTRDVEAVLTVLVKLLVSGDLVIRENGNSIIEPTQGASVLGKPVANALIGLARNALLIG